jgi:predicted metal-dependent HD superfamily phosphohydrolase
LEERILASWNEGFWALGVVPPKEAFASLMARYREPHRHYHGVSHLDSCLRELEPARGAGSRIGEVLLALLFHDAIYDPTSSENEAQSAVLAEQVLRDAEASSDVIERIVRMIRATKDHDARGDADTALLLDTDLSILGADEAVYESFEEAIRSEYAFVPEALFREGRRAVLQGFLNRPRIFLTDVFHQRLESQARLNLQRHV